MNDQHDIIQRLELRIKELEEENNSLSNRVEEILLLSLINESFETISDEKELLTAVLEKISVLKDIPYCACYEFDERSYQCLVQYCSFSNSDTCQGMLAWSDELLNALNKESIVRLNLEQQPNALTFLSSADCFKPHELLAVTFHTKTLKNGVFLFVCDTVPHSPFDSELLPFYHIIKMVIDKWDRIVLMKELRQLNLELEQRVEERASELQESEEKYRQLFSMANDAIFLWEIDSNDEVVGCSEMNDAVLKMTGFSKDDLRSINLFSLLSDDYSAKDRKKLQDMFTQHSSIFRARFKTHKGILPLEVHSRRFKLAHQQMILAIARDISEQLAYEKQIIQAKNKAIESERLKGAFLANMSHEIRTPMNAIVGFSELLGQDELTHNEVNLYADIIFKNSMHLLNLINDIVDYSKIEAEQVKIYNQSVHVNELISELAINMISMLHNASKSHIDVLTHTPLRDEEAVIFTDATRLRQVLTNLINNAIKFTSNGFIEIGYRCCTDVLEFFVRDTGIGIAPKDQKKVFDRFVQIRDNNTPNQGGTGLGLAICANLVEKMKGQMCLESTPGEGSTFCFTLPYNKSK